MSSIERRVAALEGPRNTSPLAHLSTTQLDERIERACARMGTSLAKQVARYGSERALLQALRSGQWDIDHTAEQEEGHEHD